MNNIKKIRLNCGLTQKEVADYLKINQSNYSRHEKGISLLNANQILKLCNLFKCSPNDLLGFKGVHEVVIDKMFKEAKKENS